MTASLTASLSSVLYWGDVKRMSFATEESNEPVLVCLSKVGRLKCLALFLPGENLHNHIAESDQRKA